jgi:voltage-gated potassium channel
MPIPSFRFFGELFELLRARGILVYATFYLLIVCVVATIAFSFFEGIPIFESFYWTVTTITTVGYGDIVPETTWGRVIALAVMLSGIGAIGVLLAGFADILIEKTLKRRLFMKTSMEKHIIVCGWGKKLEFAVKELLSEGKRIAVVGEIESLPFRHGRLVHIKGDPSDEEALKRANITKASFALIAGEDDVETLLSAIAVKKLNKDIHTTCIVSDPRVIRALKRTDVNRVISTQEFSGLLLSTTVFSPNVLDFISDILTLKGERVRQEKVPPKLEGRTFLQAMQSCKEEHDSILIGVVRNGKLLPNPESSMKLEKGDELFYISKGKPANA